MLEKKIEEAVNTYAKERGLLVYKFTSPNNRSVCDRMFVSSTGKVWFVEFKATGKKPTPAQTRHHQTLAQRGVTVYVVDSIALGKEIVEHESQSSWPGHHWAAIRYTGGNEVVT